MLRVLDLFSGIGGFSYGLHKAGSFKTVAFCEMDKNCHKVLNKNFPGVEIFTDVCKLTYTKHAGLHLKGKEIQETHADSIDIICGGFP
jgi:DNA (cytosine-5)-methyltransferase 1